MPILFGDSEAALYIGPHDIAQIEDCKQLSLRNCRASPSREAFETVASD